MQSVADSSTLSLRGRVGIYRFSGSHQDAIKKSLDYNEQNAETTQGLWDVAYLPIDPAHIGRGYQDVVRINSQSGKGGVAYILQRDFGFHLLRWTQIDFSRVIQQEAESRQTELTSDDVISVFENTYSEPIYFGVARLRKSRTP